MVRIELRARAFKGARNSGGPSSRHYREIANLGPKDRGPCVPGKEDPSSVIFVLNPSTRASFSNRFNRKLCRTRGA